MKKISAFSLFLLIFPYSIDTSHYAFIGKLGLMMNQFDFCTYHILFYHIFIFPRLPGCQASLDEQQEENCSISCGLHIFINNNLQLVIRNKLHFQASLCKNIPGFILENQDRSLLQQKNRPPLQNTYVQNTPNACNLQGWVNTNMMTSSES